MSNTHRSLLLLPVLLLLALQWPGSPATFAAGQTAAPKPAYSVRITPDQPFAVNAPSPAKVQVLDSTGAALPWSKLGVTAERRLHIVAVHEHLGALLHIHPEDFGQVGPTSDAFAIEPVFPFAGKYGFGFDFLPNSGDAHGGHGTGSTDGGKPIEVSSSVTIAGEPPVRGGPAFPGNEHAVTVKSLPIGDPDRLTTPMVYSSMLAPSAPDSGSDPAYLVNATTLATSHTIPAGECVFLKFQFFAVNGGSKTPATKLQKYLGADSHITVVKDDLSLINHLHGFKTTADAKPMSCDEHDSKDTAPSDASFIALPLKLATAGKYRVFLQTKVDGRMVAPSFPITVGGSPAAAGGPANASPTQRSNDGKKTEFGVVGLLTTIATMWFAM